jgi:hypothetical protein
MNDLSQQAQTRSILRDLYSPAQVQEQLTWFWFNHFNVAAGKREIRAMVGDYEDGLRTRALGRFRDLLGFTAHHPAMLQYLDNDQNAAHRINENYAREIMELHSMGVGSGYTQGDVQELARILTGVGVRLQPDAPRLKPEFQRDYLRQGLFEFNPARHDYGDKHFMGHTIRGSGIIEMEEALDIIAASPATATHVSRQLARYMLGSDPSPELVARMAATWHASKGRIADVLHAAAIGGISRLAGAASRTRCITRSRRCAMPMAIRWCSTRCRSRAGWAAWASRCMATTRPTAIRWAARPGRGRARWPQGSTSRARSAAARPACSAPRAPPPTSRAIPGAERAVVCSAGRAGLAANANRAGPGHQPAGMEHAVSRLTRFHAPLTKGTCDDFSPLNRRHLLRSGALLGAGLATGPIRAFAAPPLRATACWWCFCAGL